MRKVIFYTFRKSKVVFFLLMMIGLNVQAGTDNQSLSYNASSKEIKINQITKGNYLVVGSFLFLKNAQNYESYLRKNSFEATTGFYPGNKHYYVYLSQSTNLEELRGKRDEARVLEEFKDAWILIIGGAQAKAIKGNSNEEVVIQESAPKVTSNPSPESNPSPAVEEVAPTPKPEKVIKPGYKDYYVYLNVVSATTMKEVPAKIEVVNMDQNNLEAVLESHKTQSVELPIDGSQEVQLICEVFGYKKIQQGLNLKNPINDLSKSHVQLVGDTILVNFELVRYKKGELFTMFNVFFYNDAAVMLPKSIYELNSLLQMVKENENLKIKLHGHTNGNDYGRIIKLGPDETDYFNLHPSNMQTKGSAKDLSYARAEVIRRYLMEQGVEEDRIEIKGWGGSRTLYPVKSPDAIKNVRVEVEILKD